MKIGIALAARARAAFLVSSIIAVPLLAGCSSGGTSTSESEIRANGVDAADAVTIDFYGGGHAQSCSGTLLSPNVVLTSARCAAGSKAARVIAPNAGGAASTVAKVYTYDWGTRPNHAEEHDLALLSLRTPIHASHYATVTADAPTGAVTAFGRAAGSVVKTHTVSLESAAPAGRAYGLRLSGDAQAATLGGGVVRSDGALVGVYAGAGDSSGKGYATRLDKHEIQIWLRTMVWAKGNELSSTSPTLASLKGGAVNLENTGNTTDPSADPTDDVNGIEPGTPEEGLDPAPTGDETDGGESDPYGDDTNTRPGSDPPPGFRRNVGTNFWVSGEPGDSALAREHLYAEMHPEAAVISTHGAPGRMADTPDTATLRMVTMGRSPVIAGACFSGAADGDGNRVAADLADRAGVDRSQVYGCTGESATPTNAASMNCFGSWVDGNGRAVSDAQRTAYGLRNCPSGTASCR